MSSKTTFLNAIIPSNTKSLDKESVMENYFSYSSINTYVVGNQKDHLSQTVLLNTKNTC